MTSLLKISLNLAAAKLAFLVVAVVVAGTLDACGCEPVRCNMVACLAGAAGWLAALTVATSR